MSLFISSIRHTTRAYSATLFVDANEYSSAASPYLSTFSPLSIIITNP
ncbi:hypothetical protein RQ359_000864 [Sulfuracidifex metallicus DSM 6482 = JCM 9184]|nr:hypothetical protein RQ359_000864 [Sulfuracidifex metallicus DSM 6482 = JCM 9184]